MRKLISSILLILFLPSLLLAAEPYGLKWDILGMSLKKFKEKYHRDLPKDFSKGYKITPYCSDDYKDASNAPWELEAGIVTCQKLFPFESVESNKMETIAGVKVPYVAYQFIDGKLFSISSFFDHEGFGDIKEALLAKYGEPTTHKIKEYTNAFGAEYSGEDITWYNEVSYIELEERYLDLKTSGMHFGHIELIKELTKRIPSSRTDDL